MLLLLLKYWPHGGSLRHGQKLWVDQQSHLHIHIHTQTGRNNIWGQKSRCLTFVLDKMGAPLSSSISTTCSCPLRAPQCNGVKPSYNKHTQIHVQANTTIQCCIRLNCTLWDHTLKNSWYHRQTSAPSDAPLTLHADLFDISCKAIHFNVLHFTLHWILPACLTLLMCLHWRLYITESLNCALLGILS